MTDVKKILLILVDASVVNLEDLEKMKCESVKGIAIIRGFPGLLKKPLQLFFLSGGIKGFGNIKELEKHLQSCINGRINEIGMENTTR